MDSTSFKMLLEVKLPTPDGHIDLRWLNIPDKSYQRSTKALQKSGSMYLPDSLNFPATPELSCQVKGKIISQT